MRTRLPLFLLIATLILAGLAAAAAADTQPATTRAAKERTIVWGKATQDAQLGLRLDRSYYSPKDDPRIEILLKPAGDKPISAVPPNDDPKAEFRQLVTVEIFRNEQRLGAFTPQCDAPPIPPGKDQFVEIKSGEIHAAKFHWSDLTGNAQLSRPMDPGEYQLRVSYFVREPMREGEWPETARRPLGHGVSLVSDWAYMEVTERNPVGPPTTQPAREDLLRLPYQAWFGQPRMEFSSSASDDRNPGIRVIDAWTQGSDGRVAASRPTLVGHMPWADYAYSVDQFIRQGHEISLRIYCRPNAKPDSTYHTTYCAARLPRLLPGKYNVTMSFETADLPSAAKEPAPLTCTFEVPEPEGIDTQTLPEVFERPTAQVLLALEQQKTVRVELAQYEPIGPTPPDGEDAPVRRTVSLIVSPAQEQAVAANAVAITSTVPQMKALLLALARDGFFERAQSQKDHTPGGKHVLEFGGYWLVLSPHEESWMLEDLTTLLDTSCPPALTDLSKKAAQDAARKIRTSPSPLVPPSTLPNSARPTPTPAEAPAAPSLKIEN